MGGGVARRAPVAPEVDLGIAGLADRFGMGGIPVCLGWSEGPPIGAGGSLSSAVPRSSRAGSFIEGEPWCRHGSRPVARLDQRAIGREVPVRPQRPDLRLRQDRRHRLARHAAGEQPAAVAGEHGRDPHRIAGPRPREPAERQVALHPFHRLPRRAEGTPPAWPAPGTGIAAGWPGSAVPAGSGDGLTWHGAPRTRHRARSARRSQSGGSGARDVRPEHGPQDRHRGTAVPSSRPIRAYSPPEHGSRP